jgi:hypothetical protein
MNQLQIQEKENKILDKTRIVAALKRLTRGNNTNRKIWLVGSGNPKTPNRFYRVLYDEDLDDFKSDCKAYEFGMTIPRCHIYACAIYEGSNA